MKQNTPQTTFTQILEKLDSLSDEEIFHLLESEEFRRFSHWLRLHYNEN